MIHRSFIPVGKEENYSDEVIHDILKNINDAYRKRAGTIWYGDGVDAKIEFCLASIDPNGNPTNGIVRVNGSVMPGYDANGVFVTGGSPGLSDVQALSYWNDTSYVNIYTVYNLSTSGEYFGFGVAITNATFLEDMLYNTYIHELGHLLNLYHTFEGGCGETDCATQGDHVCDTPPTLEGNIKPGTFCEGDTTCGTNQISLVKNYMDYGNQKCHDMFTQGQVDRMRAALDTTIVYNRLCNITKKANLIKTGCDGNVPPQALFGPDKTVACIEDTVTFVNSTTRSPLSYTWTFENGNPSTSTLQNPKVQFTAVGSNKITLVATNAIGSTTCTMNYTVEGIQNPVTTGTFLAAGNQHTLTASSPYNISWFDSIAGNHVIATGSSLTTPVLHNSKTYYAQASEVGQVNTVGMSIDSCAGGGGQDGDVYFTVKKTLILQSFMVYTFTQKVKFFLRDSNATILKEVVIDGNNIPYGKMQINLNMQLSPGRYYFDLYLNNDPQNYWIGLLGMTFDSGKYPYSIDGLMSIDSTSSFIYSKTEYEYYYDWKVQEVKCKSERVPVKASVIGDVSGVEDIAKSGTNFYTYPNPANNAIFLSYTVFNASPVSIEIYDVVGTLVEKITPNNTCVGLNIYSLDIRALQSGSYFAKLQTDTGVYTTTFIK